MEVEIKRMNKYENGTMRAFVDVVVNGLSIKGFKVINGSNGLFVGNPSAKNNKDDKYYDIVRFESEEDKNTFQEKVLEHYNSN